MIIVHSAHARRVAHHLAALSAGQITEANNCSNSTPRQAPTQRGPAQHPRQGRPAPAALPSPDRPVPGRLARADRLARLQPALLVPAASLRLGRPCLSHTALPHPAGKNGHARRPSRSRAADALAPPGGGSDRPRAPPCPSPGWLPSAPAGPAAAPKRAPAASCGWSRPRTAGDSGGAPTRAFGGPGPALSLGFTLPAAAPGGSTHPSPPE